MTAQRWARSVARSRMPDVCCASPQGLVVGPLAPHRWSLQSYVRHLRVSAPREQHGGNGILVPAQDLQASHLAGTPETDLEQSSRANRG